MNHIMRLLCLTGISSLVLALVPVSATAVAQAGQLPSPEKFQAAVDAYVAGSASNSQVELLDNLGALAQIATDDGLSASGVLEDESPAGAAGIPVKDSQVTTQAQLAASSGVVTSCNASHTAKRYTFSVTQKSPLGLTVFKWSHRVHYCINPATKRVSKVRDSYDWLSAASGTTHLGNLEYNKRSVIPAASVWFKRDRQINVCVSVIGFSDYCYARPVVWSKLTVTGTGGKSASYGQR